MNQNPLIRRFDEVEHAAVETPNYRVHAFMSRWMQAVNHWLMRVVVTDRAGQVVRESKHPIRKRRKISVALTLPDGTRVTCPSPLENGEQPFA